MSQQRVRRSTAGVAAVILATGMLTAATSPAGAVATPKATSPAARQAPYVALAHTVLFKKPVKARTVASFRITGVAGVPSTASAVVLSVAVPAPVTSGTLTFYPYGTKRPPLVSLAYAKGRAATTTVVVKAGSNGRASLFNAATAGDKVAVTLLGYYAAPGGIGAANAKTQFVPLPAKRLAALLLPPGKAITLATGVPATRVAGVVLSVTVPSPAKAGSVTIYAHGTKPAAPTFAFAGGRPTTSLAIVAPGSKGRVDVLSHDKVAVRVWVSVIGYLHTLAVPSAPVSVAGVAQDGGALVSWRAPVSDGGAPVVAYRVLVMPGGTTTVLPAAVLHTSIGGLANGTPYTIGVTAVNSVGSSPKAAPSAAVIPYGVPGAPTNVVAKPSDVGTATLTWTAPTQTGGLPITAYTVTASLGGASATSTTTSATVSGVASGQYSTFTVTATNGPATSPPSARSGAVLGEGTSRVLASGTTVSGMSDIDAAITPDGRFIAFDSLDQLTADDHNIYPDVYVRDRLLGTTTMVSPHTGTTTDAGSFLGGISDDGRYVAFSSEARDLVTPAALWDDVYVRDMVSRTTALVGLNTFGHEANSSSGQISISGDGSTVAFSSSANDLVSTSNGGHDQLYVETLANHAVRIASVAAGFVPGNNDTDGGSLSADGQRVAFCNLATNLTSDDTHHALQCYINDSEGTQLQSYADATNAGNGESSTPALSPDGGFLAFVSRATNLAAPGGNGVGAIYLRDIRNGTLQQVTVGLGNTSPSFGSGAPRVSTGGRYVSYSSDADNLVVGASNHHRHAYRTDMVSGVTQLMSVNNAGVLGDNESNVLGMTADGLHVMFSSQSDNLVSGDTNGFTDLFVRDLG